MKKLTGCTLVVILVSTHALAQAPASLGPTCTLNDKEVSIIQARQETGAWCWAAVAVNVMNLYGAGSEQCKIVETVHQKALNSRGIQTCCDVGRPAECKILSGWPEWAFDIENKFSYQPLKADPWKTLTWKEATEEICNDRPFISVIDFTNGDVHTVVVIGYMTTQGEAKVRVYDPQDEDSAYVSYDEFFNYSPDYSHVGDTFKIVPNR